MALLGSFNGNSTTEIRKFESWLGKSLDYVSGHTGRANWTDYVTSVGSVGTTLAPLDKPIHWTIPMFADSGNLASAADGKYNSYYRQAAQKILAARSEDSTIYIRVGEEFNGSWFPWKAAGREQDFVDAFRQFVNSFRSVSNKFKFEWNMNIGQSMDPAKAYPGDGYVDVIGMDFYYNTQWDKPNSLDAWNYNVTRKYGLQWHQDFAKAHGKATAYSEWGVNSNGASTYITKAAEWFKSHNVLYQTYWDSNADFRGEISSGQYPTTAATYKQAFSTSTSTPPSSSTPSTPTSGFPVSGSPVKWINGRDGVNDTLTGDSHNNSLSGYSGADRMSGGAGDDTYVVDRADDVVVEAAGQGIDTVRSWAAATTLANNVENLVLIASGSQAGTGNGLANRLEGGTGANTLNGKGGHDWLKGGAGQDAFVFDTALSASANVDRIADFSVPDDTLRLSGTVFTGLSAKGQTLASSLFVKGAGLTSAKDSSDRIVYDTSSGKLYFDKDGTGSSAAVHFATLDNKAALTNADFFVV